VPRPNSTLLIFLSLSALLAANIPVYSSANGVVLTPGDDKGVVRKEFWRKAVHIAHGRRIVVWENDQEAERDEAEGEEEQ
jgi:2'-phosphotransferase